MSKTLRRAGTGLALVLGAALVSTPALGDSAAPRKGVVRAAAVGEPTIVGDVQGSGVTATGSILEDLSGRIAAELVAAEQAAALERYVAAVEAEALERYVAAVEAAALERYAAAVEAEEARRAEEARAAEAARQAEATRAAAPAPSGSVESIIQAHFGAAAGKAISVARCESGLNPRAVSAGGGNHGLFQINNVHRGTFESVTGQPWSAVYDADANTRFARWLYGQEGWGPWACA
jgi:hypothetical protein